jgi:hypothetical protein
LSATINSYGQITSASSGSSSGVIFISSDNLSTNTWTFTNLSGSLTKKVYSYSLYTDTPITTASKTTTGTTSISYGTITTNGSFIFATGNIVQQPFSATSASQITYCAGFQQTYTYSASGTAYIPSLMNAMGASLNWVVSSSSVSRNDGTCPPSASSGFSTTATLTSNTNVASCFVYMYCVPISAT